MLDKKFFKNKTILSRGTVSFGTVFIEKILKEYNPKKVVYCAEMSSNNLKKKFKNIKILGFLGDVRDQIRLERAFQNVDIVIMPQL